MSFSAFSNEFHANMFTNVENAFITKYLPWADGDAVRVYLYGLYLCARREDFEAESAAKLLKLSLDKFKEIYRFWEECGLVHILSDEPLRLEYLPVSASLGAPKPLRPEKYTEFNKELYRILQKIGKDLKQYELKKIFEFLESSEMEPQAFLLVVQYCVSTDESFTLAHVLNKAKKLVSSSKFTYEQVEEALGDFNEDDEFLKKLFSLLSVPREPNKRDREYLEKWEKDGIERAVVLECAKALKKGTLKTLDIRLKDMLEKGIHTPSAAREYLEKREKNGDAVFAIARKLGVKVENPQVYAEEYLEKWQRFGYGTEGLLALASLCFKLGLDFAEMDELLEKVRGEGVEGDEALKKYCLSREETLKLLLSVRSVCPTVKKNMNALNMIALWRDGGVSDEMILEAAARSKDASAPLPYMNRLLTEWKKEGISSPDAIPGREARAQKELYREVAVASDRRTEREHFYAVRRQSAIAAAEKNRALAEEDAEFKESESIIKRGEIELAKAELYAPETLPDILSRMQQANERRKKALSKLHLSEQDLLPHFTCPRCSDTGFLPNGAMCDCYNS